MKKIFILWILPVVIAVLLFTAVRPIMAQLGEQDISLAEFVLTNDVLVGSEERGGYRQIYYEYNGSKNFITDTRFTNANPDTEKEYIVWQAQIDNGWRIFLYDIITGTTTQLTQTGNNVNPQLNNAKIVWEGQDEGVWQINLFDGSSIKQITHGDMSLNPDMEGNIIVYGRKDSVGWRAAAYSLVEDKEVDITTGDDTKAPKMKNGKILLANGAEEFPLTADDLFVLDLNPLVTDSPQTVSEQDILVELGVATESGELQPATESGEVIN